MKALVRVALKATVLDPQGQAIQAALAKLGFSDIAHVRQGKLFEMSFGNATPRATAQEQVERAAREVLANPVIEEYSITWEE